MTEPKPPNPNGGKRQARSAAGQDQQLQQLTKLAASVEKLAQSTQGQAERLAQTAQDQAEPPTADVRKVQFAYTLLGEQLGRREVDFKVQHVNVVERVPDSIEEPRTLDFQELPGNTALLRARNGQVEVLNDLVPDQERAVVEIPKEQPIGEIVILDAPGGVPLATGCLVPPNND